MEQDNRKPESMNQESVSATGQQALPRSQAELHALLRTAIHSILEVVLEAERDAVLGYPPYAPPPEQPNRRNGSYAREVTTVFGHLRNVRVPRDRQGTYHSALLPRQQGMDAAVQTTLLQLYQQGLSTAQIATHLEALLGRHYSKATISRMTAPVAHELAEWQQRTLQRQYVALSIDALFVPIRRGTTVQKDAMYVVIGVDPTGHRELLSLWAGAAESATVWRERLVDLRHRGVAQVLLVVCDGLLGLEDAIHEVFPRADVQPCVVHEVRNSLAKVRPGDRPVLAHSLRQIYDAPSRSAAQDAWAQAQARWGQAYPKLLEQWRTRLDRLLTFMAYPPSVWRVLRSTNWSERANGTLRARVRQARSFPSEQAAEKALYLTALTVTAHWARRPAAGFAQAREEWQRRFAERYPASEVTQEI